MILLIRHNEYAPANTRIPHSILKAQGIRPPLGLAYIAANLETHHFKDQVKILDAHAENLNAIEVQAKIRELKPDIVGITSTTPVIQGALEILKLTKEVSKNITTIIGGVHLSIYPEETVQHDFVDFGIIGEGEEAIVEVLNGKLDTEGLVHKINNKVVINKLRPAIKDISTLPFPARYLLPNEKYHDILCQYPTTSIVAARGCPFNCNFCFHDSLGFRVRTYNDIVTEMEECVYKYNVKEIIFSNDCFPNKTLMIEMCQAILFRQLKVRWEAPQRIDLVELELLKLMKEAGCVRLKYGVESGNQEILDSMNKKTKLADIKRVFKITHEAGIETFGFFIIGYLGETESTMNDTIKFAKEIQPDWFLFSLATPLPNTKLFEQANIDKDYWKKITLLQKVDRMPFLVPNADKYTEQAFRQCYLRPRYIWNKVTSIRSLEQLKRYVTGGMALIKFRML
jgi:anaerobic magnesium-protoporphyrin IX monomethyl ester cyclase